MKEISQQDVTVLRTDSSVSHSWSREGSGEADAPRVLKQRFVLEEKLGSGGMGTVFRAKDLRKVEAKDRQPFLAVKVLNNDFREHPEAFIALQREAAKSQAVSHPNIVSIYDFDKDGDVPFITMELLEGQELADLLRAYPNGLPEQMAWRVIRDVCAGLRHAHEGGVVHADFKPGNVFVSPKNSAKILDFGIARAVQINRLHGDDTVFDPARLAALTPAYASREMLEGDDPEPRDDLYSLGVVIYLVLTGNHPFNRVPADEAAVEGLKPEKPKRISRRQWRVLERCLRFNRAERPGSVAVVEQFLLQPSPWRSRTALAVAATFALAVGVNYLIEDAELSEVKEEVRQVTLVDAQVARLEALLAEPGFDPAWEQQLWEELNVLTALDGAEAVRESVLAQVRGLYAARIAGAEDVHAALALYQRALRFGAVPEAGALLHDRLAAEVVALLDAPRLEDAWLGALAGALDRLGGVFPESAALAELELEVVDVLQQQLLAAVADGQFPLAAAALAALEPRLFDAATHEQLTRTVADARAAYEQQERERLARETAREFSDALALPLGSSCLRLDVAAVADVYFSWLEAHPDLERDGRAQIGERLGACMTQLAELDVDRANALQTEAERLFGTLDGLAGVHVDPCGMSYLVGSGGAGRRGSCADKLAGGNLGPRLVVVPTADGQRRFAITKHEISWDLFNEFCAATAACQMRDEAQLPVTGVGVDVARAFAAWLSERTGYTYRLPTIDEWRQAARGEPDPNRNCRVQVNGVERGLAPVAASAGQANDFGVVNILGNVQEWVLVADEIQALGGAYTDPIQKCVQTTARAHAGLGDERTGFRLVREVS